MVGIRVVSYIYGADADGNRGEVRYDYFCEGCGEEIQDTYECCPYCDEELDWDSIEDGGGYGY